METRSWKTVREQWSRHPSRVEIPNSCPGCLPHHQGHLRLPGAPGGLVCQWGIPLALYSDRDAAFKYNARQKPVPVETTQFARVMRELGIQQIFALSPQAKGRVERMLETFQDRLLLAPMQK